MSVNLKDYEFALPNTIYGTMPTVSSSAISNWQGNNFHAGNSEEWIIFRCPPGKLIKIELFRTVNSHGVGVGSPYTFLGMAKSVNSMDWQQGAEHSYYSHYTDSEDDYKGHSNNLYHSNNVGKGTTVSYGNTMFDNRLYILISSGSQGILGTGGDVSSGYPSMAGITEVINRQSGPIYMTGGDALWGGTNRGTALMNNTSSNDNKYFDDQGDHYIMSYIEYY